MVDIALCILASVYTFVLTMFNDVCRIRPEYIKHVKGVSIIHVQFQVSRDLMRLSFSESFPLLYV